MGVQFIDNSEQIKAALEQAINAGLEAAAGEVESQTKRNSRVKTGHTRNSFQHHTDTDTHTAYIGSNYENAIWEEFGTGEHAINGNGRKGWAGKKPSRAFWKAYVSTKNTVIGIIRDSIARALKK